MTPEKSAFVSANDDHSEDVAAGAAIHAAIGRFEEIEEDGGDWRRPWRDAADWDFTPAASTAADRAA